MNNIFVIALTLLAGFSHFYGLNPDFPIIAALFILALDYKEA